MAMQGGAGQVPSRGRRTSVPDQQAWDALVESYSQEVWEVARDRGLDPVEASEVYQLVWLRTADHLAELATDRIATWLREAADREARAAVARRDFHRMVAPADTPSREDRGLRPAV
jgi:DNA-directed RNA polymerase specialized sigma24 family protein